MFGPVFANLCVHFCKVKLTEEKMRSALLDLFCQTWNFLGRSAPYFFALAARKWPRILGISFLTFCFVFYACLPPEFTGLQFPNFSDFFRNIFASRFCTFRKCSERTFFFGLASSLCLRPLSPSHFYTKAAGRAINERSDPFWKSKFAPSHFPQSRRTVRKVCQLF